jgi:dTDP-glucose 4,6-dehydratase
MQGDIADRRCVDAALAGGVKTIIHLAAETHVDRSIQDAAPFVRTNILGTQVLLEAARAHRVERFLHVSTDEVYGSLGPTGCFTEDSPLAPNNPYAASKAGADLLVRSYNHTFGLPAILVRSTNIYGPYQYPEKVIPLFITRLARDEPVPIYGDGLQVRSWLHVSDLCEALLRVWKHGRPGATYNMGGGCEQTNLELAHLLLRILGKPASLLQHVADRPGHDRRYALCSQKMATELGWRPAVSFEEGLRQTARWYVERMKEEG